MSMKVAPVDSEGEVNENANKKDEKEGKKAKASLLETFRYASSFDMLCIFLGQCVLVAQIYMALHNFVRDDSSLQVFLAEPFKEQRNQPKWYVDGCFVCAAFVKIALVVFLDHFRRIHGISWPLFS